MLQPHATTAPPPHPPPCGTPLPAPRLCQTPQGAVNPWGWGGGHGNLARAARPWLFFVVRWRWCIWHGVCRCLREGIVWPGRPRARERERESLRFWSLGKVVYSFVVWLCSTHLSCSSPSSKLDGLERDADGIVKGWGGVGGGLLLSVLINKCILDWKVSGEREQSPWTDKISSVISDRFACSSSLDQSVTPACHS